MIVRDRPTIAAKFVRSNTFSRAMSWDRAIEPCTQDISVAVVSNWPEADRSLRAIQLLDREIRRCAKALAIVHGRAEGSMLPEMLDSPTLFQDALEAFPRPVHTEMGSFRVVGAEAPDLALLLEPEERVWTVMTTWPATTIAYALSSFGMKFKMNLHRNCRLERAVDGHGDALLPRLREIAQGDWHGVNAGHLEKWHADDVEELKFQAVAKSHDEQGWRLGGLHVVVWRRMADGGEDLIHGGF